MKVSRTTLFIVIGVALAVAIDPIEAQDWTGRTRISGTVKDEEGNPIEGAKVQIYLGEEGRGPDPVMTKKKGNWAFLGIKEGVWTVVASAEGKLTSQGQVQVGSTMKPVPVVLKDIPAEMLYNQQALEGKKLLEEGNLLLEQGDAAAARGKYQESLDLLEEQYHPEILIAISESYRSEDDFDTAIETLEKARSIDPENTRVLLKLSQTQYEAGNKEAAIADLEKVVEQDSDNATAIQVLTEMLISEGRHEEAEKYMAMLPETTKIDPNAILNVGIDHYNAGNMDKALEQFDRVVDQNPDMAEAYYYRGLVYLGKGENEAAAADLNTFLEMSPSSPKASEARDFLDYLEQEG